MTPDEARAMGNLHLRIGHAAEADDLVRRFHYSKRPPANVQVVATFHDEGGLFGDYGDAVAACYFCFPPTRWSETVLELARLVRVDRRIILTPLIAAACDAAKRQGHDLLVSFADRTQGHHGGIYQAASWNYAGCRDRNMDGLLVDGIFIAGRSCNSRWGTRSPAKVSAIIGREVIAHFDEGKHLYWRGLGPRGNAKAKRFGLERLPYPKPATVQAGVDA